MKKKTTEIAVNTSSGAEKVENIEKELKEENGKKITAKKTVKSTAKKAPAAENKAREENKAADKRVEAALKRKEEQEKRKAERAERAAKKAEERKKRMAEKKAAIEKRKAEKKAKAEKHAAERKALAEKRAAEKEEKIRERAHAKANRNNAQAKKKAGRGQKEKRDGREKGYGGWIAAVVSLGVVSLALATTVAVGAMEMRRNNDVMMGAYKSTMYELTGIMENVDSDLDRVRVSDSTAQQSRILTDLLVQARLAEVDLEKLPIAPESDRNVTSFINRTAAECERMLSKLRNGEELNAKDREILEYLYKTNRQMRDEVNNFIQNMTDKDLTQYLKSGVGSVKATLDKLEQTTLEENKDKIMEKLEEGKDKVKEKVEEGKDKLQEGMDKAKEKMKDMMGAGMRRMDGCAPVNGEKGQTSAAKAEELCSKYFKGYNIQDFQCVGETVTKGYAAYNVQGYDEKGNQLFAEVSQADGTLLRFDYYEDCTGETFDIRNAERIAEEFLEKLGYDDMEAVRVRANGTVSDFTFVYEDDGVAYYPDEIRIKVCRTRGLVSGFDATKYLKNHRDRDEVNVKISLAEAYEKLYDKLSVETSRLTVVKTLRGERPAYEFLCSYEGENYLVFLDALNGEEISIVNTKNIR